MAQRRPVATRLGVARQLVRGLEPGELLLRKEVRRRSRLVWIVERAGEQIHLVRAAFVLIGERRAASGAKAAAHARRRRVVTRLAARKAKRSARHGDPRSHRARSGAAAALAVAIERPARLAFISEGNRAAQAMSGGHFTSRVRMRARTLFPEMRSSPSAMGSEKRRGPALPGLTYSTPSRSSIIGLCEWPATTTRYLPCGSKSSSATLCST